jgi:dephospho-CoA kinase
MLRVGLTGGIACGKSTVAAVLRELDCVVIEADPLAHALIEPGQSAYADVRREFGPTVLEADGRVNRAKLAAIVFADPARLVKLNQITHPRVFAVLEARFAELERAGADFAVVEAALLIEANYRPKLDRLVVAWCRREQQFERLLARGLSREQIEQRLAAQMPVDEKRDLADDVIDCSGTLEHTRQQTKDLVQKLRGLAAQRRAG